MGYLVTELFEKEFSETIGCKESIAVNSGTSALIASLWSMDLQGKEVITTPFTFIATSNAIVIAGGVPVFVDIHEDTHLINEDLVEAAVNENTAAIIPVHLFGRLCDVDRMMKFGVPVIEDAAQAFGAQFEDGRFAGAVGDAGCFSFYKRKNFSTFEGGMISVNSESRLDADKMRSIIDQGQSGRFNHEYLGFNFRMPELCALLGLERIQCHMHGIQSELGLRDERHGAYPRVVYDQPIYKKLGIKGDCPIAERVARDVRES